MFLIGLLVKLKRKPLKCLGPTVEGDEVSQDVCSFPSTTGEITCSGVFYRWTYNTKTQDCEKIVYGGCYGTANLFRNQYACLAKCNQKGKVPNHLLSVIKYCFCNNIIYRME